MKAGQVHRERARLGRRLWHPRRRGFDRRRQTWSPATLGNDLGRYAFRPWSFDLTAKRGKNTVMVNATNMIGQTQTATLLFNPAGYHNNVMQSVTLIAG